MSTSYKTKGQGFFLQPFQVILSCAYSTLNSANLRSLSEDTLMAPRFSRKFCESIYIGGARTKDNSQRTSHAQKGGVAWCEIARRGITEPHRTIGIWVSILDYFNSKS
jgi:hypothetical protein